MRNVIKDIFDSHHTGKNVVFVEDKKHLTQSQFGMEPNKKVDSSLSVKLEYKAFQSNKRNTSE